MTVCGPSVSASLLLSNSMKNHPPTCIDSPVTKWRCQAPQDEAKIHFLSEETSAKKVWRTSEEVQKMQEEFHSSTDEQNESTQRNCTHHQHLDQSAAEEKNMYLWKPYHLQQLGSWLLFWRSLLPKWQWSMRSQDKSRPCCRRVFSTYFVSFVSFACALLSCSVEPSGPP